MLPSKDPSKQKTCTSKDAEPELSQGDSQLLLHTAPCWEIFTCTPPISPQQASEQPPSPLWSWSSQQVCDWLQGLHMDQYVPQFKAQQVDGQQLLHLDGAKLKVRTIRLSDRASSRSHDLLPACPGPVLRSVTVMSSLGSGCPPLL